MNPPMNPLPNPLIDYTADPVNATTINSIKTLNCLQCIAFLR